VATLTASHAGAPDARPLIAHVVYRFAVGGLENGVVNLINHMPHHRWRHVVIALTEVDPGFSARISRKDVDCLSLHKPPGQGLWLYPKLWRLLRQLRPAIVHTRNLGALEFQVPAALARVPGRIHGEHGRDADDVDGTNRRHILMRRLYRHFVHQHIALGNELGGYLQHKVGVPAAMLHTIYNGVDQTRFRPAPQRQPIEGCPFADPGLWLLGTVGRMQTVKAQPVLAQAFVLAVQAQPALRQRLRLVMVGGGALQAECQAILQAAGMSDLAWLPGERADVPDVMRGLDCFALPSLAEGISNTILEAMSTALPVLATRVGANAELVAEGTSGYLVPAGDAKALAEGVLRMASDPVAARSMGQAGRQLVEQRFSLQAMVAAYESVYRRVLRQPVVE
jgi:sugar transferase (PEP-CTERM/EpsH1 system associated)